MLKAIFEYSFLQNAIIASLLASIICGVIGVIVVEKKLMMMSGGIAHTAYGGVGLGYLLGFEPILGAGLFSVLSALLIGGVRRKNSSRTDIIISLLWSLGMAMGLFFISLMKGYPPDVNSYLFGNILSVTKPDLCFMGVLTGAVILTAVTFFSDIKAYLFDESFAKVQGLKIYVLEYGILILIALSIVALIRVVGIILVIALLSAPAACAALVSKNLKNRMLFAFLFSCFFCFLGLFISYSLSISTSASIVFVLAVTYFSLLLISKKICRL